MGLKLLLKTKSKHRKVNAERPKDNQGWVLIYSLQKCERHIVVYVYDLQTKTNLIKITINLANSIEKNTADETKVDQG